MAERPVFLNEWLWYPPLIPWIIGAASWLAGVPASLADVRLGPYLNILSPLAFYALVSMWFGRRAALASLVVFVFFDRGPYGSTQRTPVASGEPRVPGCLLRGPHRPDASE